MFQHHVPTVCHAGELTQPVAELNVVTSQRQRFEQLTPGLCVAVAVTPHNAFGAGRSAARRVCLEPAGQCCRK